MTTTFGTTPISIVDISEDQVQDVEEMLSEDDKHYWDDNGDVTDGPSYLMEANDLTEEQRSTLHVISQPGTYFAEYDANLHKDALQEMSWQWCGWSANGYALILAPVSEVNVWLAALPEPEEEI